MQLIDLIKFKFSKRLPVKTTINEFLPLSNVQFFSNCYFHPYTGIYMDESRNVITESAFHLEKMNKLIDRSRFLTCLNSSRAISIGHGPWNNYYHWYIDSLPRVFGLREIDSLKSIELFISQPLSKEEKNLLQALVGQNIKIRYVSRFTMVKAREAYYLPFLSKSCDAELPAEYLNFYRSTAFKLFTQSPPSVPFKIFISRAGSGRRVFMNELEVENTLQKKGYTILRLEKLTLSQQIYYFRFANRVIASHGAGLTNLLYSSQCDVLEIFHSEEILGHYKGLCKALGLTYAYRSLDGKHKDEIVSLPMEDIKDWISQ